MSVLPVTTTSPAFVSWMEGAQKIVKDYHDRCFPTLPVRELRIDGGRKFIKIVDGGSVWAFIDTTTGDVLKPASWKAPAKHARGNIFDANNGLGSVGPYGPDYLCGPNYR